MLEGEKGRRRPNQKGHGGAGTGRLLCVPGIAVAEDSEKQGQYLVEVLGKISDREAGEIPEGWGHGVGVVEFVNACVWRGGEATRTGFQQAEGHH